MTAERTQQLVGGRYEIVRELGRGGMGEVLLARQTNLGRLVVVKRVPPDHPAKHVEALLAEARVAARLHHPAIVSVLDVSAEDEEAFIAMEYIAGITLRDMLQRAPEGLPVPIALFIAIDVLRGLAYAHGVKSGASLGIVHRDVKPRNIMVTFAGDTKLIDFGISRWLEITGSWEATSVSGTRGYMAPEQQAGLRADGRADQYAVGVTLREMLTGISPNDGEATAEMIGTPKPPRETPLDEPGLAAIVARACERARELRYHDCVELAAALEAYATEHDLVLAQTAVQHWIEQHLADRISAFEREAQRASESDLGDPPSHRRSRTAPTAERTGAPTVSSGEQLPATRRASIVRRSPWLVAGAVAVLAAAGGGLGWRMAGSHGGNPGDPHRVVLSVTAGGAGSAASAASAGSAASAASAANDDAWLAPAVEHIAHRELRDAEARRFALAAPADRGARQIELVYQLVPAGVHLEARDRGAPDPRDVLAAADAPSVAGALAHLVPELATALSADLPPLEPDAAERADMTRLGARTFAQYRRFLWLYEHARFAGWLDSETIEAGYELLLRDDPTWGRLYGELQWLYAPGTTRSAQIVRDAEAHADRARDPAGYDIVHALGLMAEHHTAEALPVIEAVYEHDDGDMLAGETYQSALYHSDRVAEGNAVTQRLMERYPSLYYTGDRITDLEEQGRDDEAGKLATTAFAAYPDNLTAAREAVRLAAERGDQPAAQQIAQRMQLVHGDDPFAAPEIFDVLVISDDMLGAQRVADHMLLGSPMSRARGRYRSAVIAAMQGRFGAAFEQAKEAADAFGSGSHEPEVPEALGMLRWLAPVIGDAVATATFGERYAKWFDDNARGGVAFSPLIRYQLELGVRASGAACPELDVSHVEVDEREDLQRDARRFAARAGCGPCKDVVAAGLQTEEYDPSSLIAFGRCALDEHELGLAKRAFEQASRLWSSWDNRESSPYHAVLAQFYLGETAVAAGDIAAARAHYTRFLHAWEHADRAIPEVHEAERALATLH